MCYVFKDRLINPYCKHLYGGSVFTQMKVIKNPKGREIDINDPRTEYDFTPQDIATVYRRDIERNKVDKSHITTDYVERYSVSITIDKPEFYESDRKKYGTGYTATSHYEKDLSEAFRFSLQYLADYLVQLYKSDTDVFYNTEFSNIRIEKIHGIHDARYVDKNSSNYQEIDQDFGFGKEDIEMLKQHIERKFQNQ